MMTVDKKDIGKEKRCYKQAEEDVEEYFIKGRGMGSKFWELRSGMS
jgi:hypothetical protein